MSASRTSKTGSLIRGQGVNIFWGGLSLFFAAAAVYYFWQYVEQEQNSRILRDQEIQITQENQQLRSQVDKLQESIAQVDNLLETRDQKMREQANAMEQAVKQVEHAEKERIALADKEAKRVANIAKIRAAVLDLEGMDAIDIITRDQMPVLRIENASLFEPGSLKLQAKALRTLQRVAQSYDSQLDANELVIESFTDSDPVTGSMLDKYPSNYDLAAARGSVVARFLIDRGGLPADRVVVLSRGPNYPVMPNTTPDLKAQNRRVEILLRPPPRMMRTIVPQQTTATQAAPEPVNPEPETPEPTPPAEPEVVEIEVMEGATP